MSKQYVATVKRKIGQNIRAYRARQKLSLRQFGLMVGVDYPRLQAIEHGRANPTLETLIKIAEGLDISVIDLFKDAG